MTNLRASFSAVLILALCLALAGCPPAQPVTPDQALTALEAAVASAEVVVVALGATGTIPANLAAEITAAMLPLPGIFRQTAQELATKDTDVIKALTITGYFEPEIQSLDSLPPQAKVWTGAVMSAIKVFLAFYVVPGNVTLKTAPRGGHVTVFDPAHLSTVTLKIGMLQTHMQAVTGK